MFKFFNKQNKYFKNISWQFGEKALLMGISFVVNIIVARFLGASKLGELQYVNTMLSFFAIITYLGLNGILTHELVNNPSKTNDLLSAVFGVKLIASLLAFSSFILTIYIINGSNSIEFYLSLIVGVTLLLKPFDVIISYFDSKVSAKYYAIANSVSTFIGALVKVFLVFLSASIIYFGGVVLLISVLFTLLLVYFFIGDFELRKHRIRFDFRLAISLLKKSWMLTFSAIFAIMYLKIDQVMIKMLQGSYELGVYSVAVNLSEIWYFIPSIIATTIFPKLIELKKLSLPQYLKKLQLGYDGLFLLGFTIAVVVSLVATPVINILYGQEYYGSANILMIHIWSGVFIFMRALFSRWIIMEGLIKYSLLTHGVGALVNIVLNFVLIPRYGGIGAAIASLLSYAFSSYFALFISKETRSQAIMMTRAIFSPLRIKTFLKDAR